MFDFFQKNKRVAQVILILLAITLLTWGVESYTNMSGSRDAVASVNGYDISQREFADQLRRQQDQLRRMFGGAVDPASLDTPQTRRALLDSMIDERLLAVQAARADLLLSRDAVIAAITQAPEFQQDGKFSTELYQAYLASRGITDEGNVIELQSRLPMARLAGSVASTAIAPRSVAARLAAIEAEKREIAEARVTVQPFLAQAKVEDAEIEAHYQANRSNYRTPERVQAQYVVLSAESLGRQAPPTEAEIKAAYEARIAQYRVEEQRRASHILVKTKEEAQKLLEQLQKAPARFAELAKKHSEDAGSAQNGGDLGWFSRGMMVKPFEDAAFALEANRMRVVESEFGFHVLRVTGVRAGKTQPLAQVRSELAEELAREKGARKFIEAAETFSNMVYEQPDSLEPVAERFGLNIQRTGWVAKSADQELGALDHPELLAALFSSDAIEHKRNTDAVEVAPNTLVAARVVEHQPARQRELKEVRDEIAELLRQRKASELAYKDGLAKLERLRKGENAGVNWSAVRTVSRRDAQGLPADVLRQVMAADVSGLPAYIGSPVPDAGYRLIRISKVIPADPSVADEKNAERVAGMLGAAQLEAYLASLRSRADIDINAVNLERN